MSIQQRAVLVADERRAQTTIRDLRAALNKAGTKDLLCTQNLTDISNIVCASQWPFIFIDHDSEFADGLRQFERIYRSAGHQLFNYFMILPTDENVIRKSFRSLGLSGVVHKAALTGDVAEVVIPCIKKNTDAQLKSAHEFALAVLKKDYPAAEIALNRVNFDTKEKIKIEMARIFLTDAQGAGPKVMSLFQKRLKADSAELRVLSDYAFFLRKFSIYDVCFSVLEKISQKHPLLIGKVWEEILYFSEFEKFNEIAKLIELLNAGADRQDDTDCLMARMMNFLGLESHIPKILHESCTDFAAYQELVRKENDIRAAQPHNSRG